MDAIINIIIVVIVVVVIIITVVIQTRCALRKVNVLAGAGEFARAEKGSNTY